MATFITIFLFSTVLTSSISDECNYGTAMPYFQQSVYGFTLKLLSRINEKTRTLRSVPRGNFVTSALCPWTLLLVMSLSGSDALRQEIQHVLELQPHSCFVHIYIELLKQVTMKHDNPISSMIERSSTIFYNASEKINQSFFDDLSKAGIYSSQIMYFESNHDETAHSINEHVQIATDEAITDIVTSKNLVGISTLTIDALAFRGAWKVAFPYEDTETGAFYDDAGEQIGDVSLMYMCESYKVINVSEINATVLELPYYGNDNRYSLLIYLPCQNVSLTTMLDLMKQHSNINLGAIFQLFEQTEPKQHTVQLPKFQITSKLDNWKELLMSIGINTIFEDQEATIPGVTYYKFLANFIQKVELEVIEDGLNNGRATAMLMQSRFQYDEFVANRPFLFMVVDTIQRVPIITGAYSKPSFNEEDVAFIDV